MELRYGSDQNGLICGYLFRPSVPGEPLGLADALRWLSDAGAPGFVWLHFNLADASAERWIQAELPAVEEFFDALRQGTGATRIGVAGDSLVAVLNDVAYEFSFEPSEIETLWLQVGPRMALTGRRHALRSIDRLRQDVKNGECFDSSVALLNRLMHEQGDVLVRIVHEATQRVDRIEDQMLTGRPLSKRNELGKLRRVLVRLQRLLAPEPGAMFRLLRQPPPWCAADDMEKLRQVTEEFSLVLRNLSALQERIKLLQEEIVAQVGEQTNRSVFTLTVVTVLALPINIVAGLFGMNVGGIPLSDFSQGFLVIVGFIILFTLIAGWLAFRRRD